MKSIRLVTAIAVMLALSLVAGIQQAHSQMPYSGTSSSSAPSISMPSSGGMGMATPTPGPVTAPPPAVPPESTIDDYDQLIAESDRLLGDLNMNFVDTGAAPNMTFSEAALRDASVYALASNNLAVMPDLLLFTAEIGNLSGVIAEYRPQLQRAFGFENVAVADEILIEGLQRLATTPEMDGYVQQATTPIAAEGASTGPVVLAFSGPVAQTTAYASPIDLGHIIGTIGDYCLFMRLSVPECDELLRQAINNNSMKPDPNMAKHLEDQMKQFMKTFNGLAKKLAEYHSRLSKLDPVKNAAEYADLLKKIKRIEESMERLTEAMSRINSLARRIGELAQHLPGLKACLQDPKCVKWLESTMAKFGPEGLKRFSEYIKLRMLNIIRALGGRAGESLAARLAALGIGRMLSISLSVIFIASDASAFYDWVALYGECEANVKEAMFARAKFIWMALKPGCHADPQFVCHAFHLDELYGLNCVDIPREEVCLYLQGDLGQRVVDLINDAGGREGKGRDDGNPDQRLDPGWVGEGNCWVEKNKSFVGENNLLAIEKARNMFCHSNYAEACPSPTPPPPTPIPPSSPPTPYPPTPVNNDIAVATPTPFRVPS